MKKMLFALMAMLAIAASARAMTYEQARNEALFLTDKMAYELNLTDEQYEAAYEINLDYLMGVTGRHDVFGSYWERRNLDLSYVLYSWQWEAFRAATYFYRPLYWDAGFWHFGIYARYPHRDYFYFGRPHFYASYRGGHSWHMNGGRSFYEPRREHFQPARPRENHVGMRDGWNRGDYRGNRTGSSTRFTGAEQGRNGGRTGGNGRIGGQQGGGQQNRSEGGNVNRENNPSVNHGTPANGNGRSASQGERQPNSRSITPGSASSSRTYSTPSRSIQPKNSNATPSRSVTAPSRSSVSTPSRTITAPSRSSVSAPSRSSVSTPSRSVSTPSRSGSSGSRSASRR